MKFTKIIFAILIITMLLIGSVVPAFAADTIVCDETTSSLLSVLFLIIGIVVILFLIFEMANVLDISPGMMFYVTILAICIAIIINASELSFFLIYFL